MANDGLGRIHSMQEDAGVASPIASCETDFYRTVYCILGLPFDAINLEQAALRIRRAADAGQRCFLSTPNLNFLVNSLRDPAFRASVIRSDLSIADGIPIVWIARVLRIPITSRVAGSTLFEILRMGNGQRLSVYFFGGPDGVAKAAADKLNAAASGLRCVGYQSPGFGSIEDMSNDHVIDEINRSAPDFVVVALGARRGQAWIEHNLDRLSAPIVSHLGAVVNFVAGTVTRAPLWVRRIDFEWFWRIKEEPVLWHRYLADGCSFLKLLVTKVIPSALNSRARLPIGPERKIAVAVEGRLSRIAISGDWREEHLAPLRDAFDSVAKMRCSVRIQCGDLTSVDSAFIGLLIVLYGHQSKLDLGFALDQLGAPVLRQLRLYCAEYLIGAARA